MFGWILQNSQIVKGVAVVDQYIGVRPRGYDTDLALQAKEPGRVNRGGANDVNRLLYLGAQGKFQQLMPMHAPEQVAPIGKLNAGSYGQF